jgi:hypothetical protein
MEKVAMPDAGNPRGENFKLGLYQRIAGRLQVEVPLRTAGDAFDEPISRSQVPAPRRW